MSQHQNSMFLDSSDHTSDIRHDGFANTGFPSCLSLPRGVQRPSHLFQADHIGTFSPRVMDHTSPNIGGYVLDSNNDSWLYNATNMATINGAMTGSNRQRSINRRTALPQTWTDPVGLGLHTSLSSISPLANDVLSNGSRLEHVPPLPEMRNAPPLNEDQLIPTAIVIKNIHFAVRKETLARIMTELGLPQPYAFNYHFDKGVFRGLAFANFQSPEDTRLVIEAMNGLEVQGRQLRVEYKKLLPKSERDRIDREKREKRGQLEEQHRAPLHQRSSMQSLTNMSSSGQTSRRSPLKDIDLNDPDTLGFYTELTIFQRDDQKEALIFDSTITPEQRRQIHILAHHMGLVHESTGEADSRQIHVMKRQIPSPTQINTSIALDIHKRGLSRAATFDFAADRERNASMNYSHILGRHGPMLEVPGSPDGPTHINSLRTAKSFADLRSFSPSPAQSSSSYMNAKNGIGQPSTNIAHFGTFSGLGQSSIVTPNLTPTTPGTETNKLVNSLGNLNLAAFESANSQPRTTPGAIGSQRPGANQASRNISDRHPRGSEEPSAGFVSRGRTNGHIQRESDSSDNTPRIPGGSIFS